MLFFFPRNLFLFFSRKIIEFLKLYSSVTIHNLKHSKTLTMSHGFLMSPDLWQFGKCNRHYVMQHKKKRVKKSRKKYSLIKPGLHCAIYFTFISHFMCWKYFDMDRNLLHISSTKILKVKKKLKNKENIKT